MDKQTIRIEHGVRAQTYKGLEVLDLDGLCTGGQGHFLALGL